MDPNILFEFDCPKSGSLERSICIDDSHDYVSGWFMISHEMHEPRTISSAANESLGTICYPNLESKITVQMVQFGKQKNSSKFFEENNKQHNEDDTSRPVMKRKGKQQEDKKSTLTRKKIPKVESIEDEKQDMLKLLRKHNEKFTPISLYEPSRHSVRDVRHWEKITGKYWSILTPEERVAANDEILRMKLSSN